MIGRGGVDFSASSDFTFGPPRPLLTIRDSISNIPTSS